MKLFSFSTIGEKIISCVIRIRRKGYLASQIFREIKKMLLLKYNKHLFSAIMVFILPVREFDHFSFDLSLSESVSAPSTGLG